LVESILDKEEFEVYKAVKLYLKQNHFFKIDEITSYLKFNLDRSLNLNTLKIEKVLQSLLKKNLIAPRSKLLYEDILSNQNRKLIYDFIESNPGCYLNEIMKTTSLGTHQTIWHKNILKKFQFIRSINIDNHEIYFKSTLDSTNDQIIYYLKNESVKKIIKFMENIETGFQATEISEKLKMHYNTARKYINILLDLELITINKEGDKKFYLLNAQNYYDTIENLRELKIIS